LMDQGGGVTEYDITGTLLSQTKGHEPIVMSTGQGNAEIINGHAPTLNCNHEAPILSYGIPGNWIGRKPENGGNAVQPMDNISPNLTSTDRHAVCAAMQVRRLTPRCCERLQGFQWRLDGPTMPGAWKDEHGRWWSPDWTANFSDSTRYKMMGNAVCVAVSEWIARRLAKNIDEHEGAAQ